MALSEYDRTSVKKGLMETEDCLAIAVSVCVRELTSGREETEDRSATAVCLSVSGSGPVGGRRLKTALLSLCVCLCQGVEQRPRGAAAVQ